MSDKNLKRLMLASSLGLAALTAVLALQVRTLRPLAEELEHRKTFPYVGQWVPTIRAATLTGDSVTLGETDEGRAQVVFVFSTQCQFCLETLPAWNALASVLASDSAKRFDVYWLSLSPRDSTRSYAARHSLRGLVLNLPSPKMRKVFRLNTTPLTLVLDRNGRIIYSYGRTLNSGHPSIDSVIAIAMRSTSRPPPAATRN